MILFLLILEKFNTVLGKSVEPEFLATGFSTIFGLDYDETLAKVNSNSSVSVIAKKVEKDVISTLEEWMKQNKIVSGINIDEDSKRYYPYGSLASNLIGFCGTEKGLEGLEAKWNTLLTGTSGKIVTTTDLKKDAISDENQLYVAAENGSNIYLTIDTVVQNIAEKYLEQGVIENKAEARNSNYYESKQW